MEEQVRQRWSSTVKSINHQRRKPTFNEGNRRSTINSQRQSSTIASRFYTYLLSAATISTIKMADNIRSRSDNSKRSITIGNQKSIYPKGKDRDFINSQKRKWNGSRTYLESQATPRQYPDTVDQWMPQRRRIGATTVGSKRSQHNN